MKPYEVTVKGRVWACNDCTTGWFLCRIPRIGCYVGLSFKLDVEYNITIIKAGKELLRTPLDDLCALPETYQIVIPMICHVVELGMRDMAKRKKRRSSVSFAFTPQTREQILDVFRVFYELGRLTRPTLFFISTKLFQKIF